MKKQFLNLWPNASLLLKSTISWRSWRSISRVLALNNPAPQEFVAVDSFGESGTPCPMENQIEQSS
jgi:hypothetical protein